MLFSVIISTLSLLSTSKVWCKDFQWYRKYYRIWDGIFHHWLARHQKLQRGRQIFLVFTALFNNPTYNSFKSFPCSDNTRLITLRLRMFLYLIKNILTIYKFWDNDDRVSLYVLSYRFTVCYRYSECCSHKNHNSVKLFSLARKL